MAWRHVRDTTQAARKDYKCFLCGESIRKGEEYVRRFGYVDDGPTSDAMHPECEEHSAKWDLQDWDCFEPGSMERPK